MKLSKCQNRTHRSSNFRHCFCVNFGRSERACCIYIVMRLPAFSLCLWLDCPYSRGMYNIVTCTYITALVYAKVIPYQISMQKECTNIENAAHNAQPPKCFFGGPCTMYMYVNCMHTHFGMWCIH